MAAIETDFSADPVMCRCQSTCSRRRGRGACPCRMEEKPCNESCKCGTNRKPCRNFPESDSSNEGGDEPEHLPTRVQDRDPAENQEEVIQAFLQDLERGRLEEIAAQLIRRNPGAYQDIVLQRGNADVGPPQHEAAEAWCVCGHCRPMNSVIEQKCCRNRDNCLATTAIFSEICLNGNVLDVAMRANEDMFADNPDRSNANFRYYAYRQYIYWQHGRLGASRRLVIPSCCVWKIRELYPSENGVYRGFHLGEAVLVD